jgi:hypothetical protein
LIDNTNVKSVNGVRHHIIVTNAKNSWISTVLLIHIFSKVVQLYQLNKMLFCLSASTLYAKYLHMAILAVRGTGCVYRCRWWIYIHWPTRHFTRRIATLKVLGLVCTVQGQETWSGLWTSQLRSGGLGSALAPPHLTHPRINEIFSLSSRYVNDWSKLRTYSSKFQVLYSL